jgi:hypothetical protein
MHATSFHSMSARHCDTPGLTVNGEPGKKSSPHLISEKPQQAHLVSQ